MTPQTAIAPAGVELLLALEELRTLKARYWRYVDTKRWDAFGTLFAPDATFTDHSAGFSCDGRDGIVSGISGVLDDIRTMHQGQQSELEILGPDEARGIWAMQDYLVFPPGAPHPTNPQPVQSLRGWGHYVERYVRVDGAWRFRTIDLYRLRLETTTVSNTDYPPDFTLGG